jgi:hypothetical protein
MDVKMLRAKYIDMLCQTTLIGIQGGDISKFAGNSQYRLKQNLSTVNLLDKFCKDNYLDKDQLRWLKDTWLY